MKDERALTEALPRLADLALRQTHWVTAAHLLAAAEALPATRRLAPAARANHEHNCQLVRAQVGDGAFAQLWAEGQALTLGQAVKEATALLAHEQR